MYDSKRAQRTNSSVLRLGIDSQQTSLLQKNSDHFATFVKSRAHNARTTVHTLAGQEQLKMNATLKLNIVFAASADPPRPRCKNIPYTSAIFFSLFTVVSGLQRRKPEVFYHFQRCTPTRVQQKCSKVLNFFFFKVKTLYGILLLFGRTAEIVFFPPIPS